MQTLKTIGRPSCPTPAGLHFPASPVVGLVEGGTFTRPEAPLKLVDGPGAAGAHDTQGSPAGQSLDSSSLVFCGL